ncbi:MAG: hypothetical protein JRF02_07755, partial [Deltaproteobacteria bacterium]|nr:hypothetical protein [Deltaproteobacteria bacterium]
MKENFKKAVVAISDSLSDIMNVFILFIMLALIVGAIGVLVMDIFVFYKAGFSSGMGIVLGSLLVLWILM